MFSFSVDEKVWTLASSSEAGTILIRGYRISKKIKNITHIRVPMNFLSEKQSSEEYAFI